MGGGALDPGEEAAFKADYAYILDAVHTRFPLASVGVNLPWARGEDVDAATAKTWIEAVLLPRAAWTFIAVDEAVTVKGADDGATNTYDGIHLSAAGITAVSQAIVTAMGY